MGDAVEPNLMGGKGEDQRRPDIAAARRGGDWSQPMNGEVALSTASLKEARYWTGVYSEILAMEEKVLVRVRKLMNAQSAQVKQEVELTNVPVIVAQVERFRQRLGYWRERAEDLGLDSSPRRPRQKRSEADGQ